MEGMMERLRSKVPLLASPPPPAPSPALPPPPTLPVSPITWRRARELVYQLARRSQTLTDREREAITRLAGHGWEQDMSSDKAKPIVNALRQDPRLSPDQQAALEHLITRPRWPLDLQGLQMSLSAPAPARRTKGGDPNTAAAAAKNRVTRSPGTMKRVWDMIKDGKFRHDDNLKQENDVNRRKLSPGQQTESLSSITQSRLAQERSECLVYTGLAKPSDHNEKSMMWMVSPFLSTLEKEAIDQILTDAADAEEKAKEEAKAKKEAKSRARAQRAADKAAKKAKKT